MSEEIVQQVLTKLGSDSSFRQRMSKDPAATLDKDYPNKLTEPEKTALTKMAAGFTADLKEAGRPWWQPGSFKEVGAAFLSAVLIGLLFWTIVKTFGLIATLPQGVTIGSGVQVIDTFSRAKDLLNTLLPLFGAVVTFWLGIAVEGKRADQNQETANKESQNRANAEDKERKTKAVAAATIGAAKAHAIALRDATKAKRTLAAAPEPEEAARLDALVRALEEGERIVIS